MAFHTAWEKDLSPFSAFLGFSSSLETQSSSHSLSIESLGPCFSTVGIGGGQLLIGTEGPPQFCVRMQWGKRSHFAFWARFIFSTKVISSLSLLLPRPIAKEEAALRNVFSALKWSWKPQLGFKQNMHGAGTVLQLSREGRARTGLRKWREDKSWVGTRATSL